MKNSIVLTTIALVALFACKNDPKTTTASNEQNGPTASAAVLEGNWIASDFVSHASNHNSILKGMSNAHIPFAFAYSFSAKKPDSIMCFEGNKSVTHFAKYNVDTIEIVNAREGKSVFLIYQSKSDKSMTVIDPTGQKTTIERLTKTRDNAVSGYEAFNTSLNHNLLGGAYNLVGKGNAQVVFAPGGSVNGLPGFNAYQVCVFGDCFLAGDAIDVIYLSDTKAQKGDFFGFKVSTQRDTLSIYNLVKNKADEKAVATIGSKAFTLLRNTNPDVPTKQPERVTKPN